MVHVHQTRVCRRCTAQPPWETYDRQYSQGGLFFLGVDKLAWLYLFGVPLSVSSVSFPERHHVPAENP